MNAQAWVEQLETVQRRRNAGGSWQPQLRKLAADMEAAGATELAREARHVMAVVRSAPDIKTRLLADLIDATAAWAPAAPAPATVVPTRYAPDGITVLQPRRGELVTLLVQSDGRDVQALELTPDLASHLLHSLLDHADRPRII